jgi:glycosyltransferase involved in cell wall biosynthesis
VRKHNKELGYSIANVRVIPNGFDTETFRPDLDARKHFRASIGIDDDTQLIGLIGRFHPVKDHATFFQAASIVRQRTSNIRLVLAGNGIETSNKGLMELIDRANVGDITSLLGLRNDLPRINAALDVVCLSSVSEGFPNVLGEAMSSGVPCVSTNVGDAAWIVGNTGELVALGRPDLLANAICRLLSMESENRRNLGKLARCRIIDNFSLHSVVEEYQALYVETLERGKKGSVTACAG